MGWITPAIQFLQKRVALCLEIICSFSPSGRHLYLLRNKNTPSDAESREEQDGSKHKFVGGTMAVMARFGQGYSEKHRREMKMKELNPAEEGDFPCKL